MVGRRLAERRWSSATMVGWLDVGLRFAGMPIVWLCLLLAVQGGCSGFAKRFQRDDVVAARQIARQGADAFSAGDWDRAEQYFSKAVEACPVDERVRARYAETLWNRGMHQEAIKHQREAVRLSGDDPEMTIRLGEMYLARGDLQQANRMAAVVVDSGVELASAHRLRGDVLSRQDKWREALAAYQRALSIRPNYPEVQMAVAQVYQLNGRPQRALATLQSLAEAYPPGEEPADLLYWHAMAFASLGRQPQAVRQFVMAYERGMRTADLQFRLAESHYLAGDRAAARAALERAMQLDPHHPQAARLCQSIEGAARVASIPD